MHVKSRGQSQISSLRCCPVHLMMCFWLLYVCVSQTTLHMGGLGRLSPSTFTAVPRVKFRSPDLMVNKYLWCHLLFLLMLLLFYSALRPFLPQRRQLFYYTVITRCILKTDFAVLTTSLAIQIWLAPHLWDALKSFLWVKIQQLKLRVMTDSLYL